MAHHRLFAAAAVILAVAAPAGAASAHARLVRSTPAADAIVAAPGVISLTFSDRMVPAFSTLDLVDAAGRETAVRATVSEDGKTLSARPLRPLAAGAWTVNWRIATHDGHRITGSYGFTVR
ncbi:copper homeostasis periplasmic binding protein CopC [Brevundimonas sp.]|uniref:copper homeostasis periplasmic binding protein CopC n=1 Tax=Brevundimonas sp. TaxID=1871086 RepID=UPI002D7073AD|nr:copper homeostasis periplasmic binding protein CopC [Brevundimonas sp.]HYC68005.1 copper homeostasis periplasmic binding protein CopC [Brevundimonas sp.]